MATNRKSKWGRIVMPGLLLSALLAGATINLPSPKDAEAATAGSTQTASLTTTLLQKLKARSPAFTLQVSGSASSSLRTVDQAFQTAMKQDDYTNYTIESYSYSSKSDGTKAAVTVKVSYWENAAQSAYVTKRSKEILASIIKPGMNDHQKVKAIHDWVLLNVAYDRTLRKHSAYDALVSGQAVCQGYASLTYRLLTDAGIPARIAEGNVESGAHAWNLVKVGGKWYQLDTTFDDPVPDVAGRTTYSYYLVTDDQLRRDHSWTLSYPAASTSYADALLGLEKSDPSRKSFYAGMYSKLGYQYLLPENSVRTIDDIAAVIQKAVKNGRTSAKVRFVQGANKKLDLQAILDQVPAIHSIRTVTSAFPAGDPGDVLLELTFTTTS